jgi:hypothetical protein
MSQSLISIPKGRELKNGNSFIVSHVIASWPRQIPVGPWTVVLVTNKSSTPGLLLGLITEVIKKKGAIT